MKGTNQVINGCGVHHISIKVSDYEKSVTFYKALGFTEYTSWGEGNDRMMLLDTGDGNYLEICAGGPKNANPVGVVTHFAFRTDDCAAAMEKAKAIGAEVKISATEVDLPGKVPMSVTFAFIKGLDGEEIEFFQQRA